MIPPDEYFWFCPTCHDFTALELEPRPDLRAWWCMCGCSWVVPVGADPLPKMTRIELDPWRVVVLDVLPRRRTAEA